MVFQRTVSENSFREKIGKRPNYLGEIMNRQYGSYTLAWIMLAIAQFMQRYRIK